MKRAKERGLEPLRGLWWVEQSKGKLTKRPSSRQHRPLRNNSSNRKRKQEPRTNRVSTPSNEHFLHAWTLADTRSSDSLGLTPGKRLTAPGIFLLLYKIPQCKPAIGFVEQSNFKRLDLRISPCWLFGSFLSWRSVLAGEIENHRSDFEWHLLVF